MKSMKRALSLGLALMVMTAATSVAYARYAYIRQFTFDGDIGSTSVYGEAYVSLDGQDSSMTTITLQRSSDGGRTYKTDRVLTARHTTSSSYSAVGEADNLNPAYNADGVLGPDDGQMKAATNEQSLKNRFGSSFTFKGYISA